MWSEAYAASGVVTLATVGLLASNILFDKGLDSSLSRRVPGALGGFAYLIAVLWLDPWTAISLSAALGILIIVLRLGFRRRLRGVAGNLPTQALAEITFPIAGTAALAIGWGLLGNRWLAFVPIAFMAWGDNVAGLVRAYTWDRNVMSVWPSIAMFGVCLLAANLFHPYWIGALGALVATLSERYRPMVTPLWDDNLHVVAISLAVMAVLVKNNL